MNADAASARSAPSRGANCGFCDRRRIEYAIFAASRRESLLRRAQKQQVRDLRRVAARIAASAAQTQQVRDLRRVAA
jgi:hypothetical protein